MKKLLVLSGDAYHIPFIQKAVEMGHYVITCDYFPHNPGHPFAHEYHNVSYMDQEAVYALAKKLKIDGITCFAADEAMPVVGYVAQQLGLPTHPLHAINIIHHKEKFRSFLQQHHFPVPFVKAFHTLEEAQAAFPQLRLPAIVKPVDSSGSRGVSKIDTFEELTAAVNNALRYSREKRFLIEEYIETNDYQVGGDGFTVNGELVFHCFSNNHLTNAGENPFIPLGGSWPSVLPASLQQKIQTELQRLLSLLEVKTGPFNFDIRINERQDVYVIEMGARNGGNYIPEITKYATGVDLIDYTIRAALGEDCSDLQMVNPSSYWCCYTLHSTEKGTLKQIEIDSVFQQSYVVSEKHVKNVGDAVNSFSGSDQKIGTLLLHFPTWEEMQAHLQQMDQWVKVKVETDQIERGEYLQHLLNE